MFNHTNYAGFLAQLNNLEYAAYTYAKSLNPNVENIRILSNGSVSYEFEINNNECDCRRFTAKIIDSEEFTCYLKKIGFRIEIERQKPN